MANGQENRHLLANLNAVFAAIDAKDTSRFLSYLTDDCIFRFGSAAAVSGKEAIGAAVDGFFSTIAASRHTLHKTLSDDTSLACEGIVEYQRHDDTRISLPFTNMFEVEGGLIRHYKIYIDIAPLFA